MLGRKINFSIDIWILLFLRRKTFSQIVTSFLFGEKIEFQSKLFATVLFEISFSFEFPKSNCEDRLRLYFQGSNIQPSLSKTTKKSFCNEKVSSKYLQILKLKAG